jgi:hypothetical protein
MIHPRETVMVREDQDIQESQNETAWKGYESKMHIPES